MRPELKLGYRECARLTRAYGTTYYWGARLLPLTQRRQVYAVYALCRLADDIVDFPRSHVDDTRAALWDFHREFQAAIEAPQHARPVLAAVADTVRATGVDQECFERFFGAMAMDLDTFGYASFDDLLGYMEGSAAVIGEMMLPVLRPTSPAAKEPARSLGFAFQLTNFLRDVDEDLDRGRVYIPQDDLDRFGVDIHSRRVDDAWRAMMAFQIARNRELYTHADTGIAYLPGASARCVGTARVLYSRILERIEAADYDVFSHRARVPTRQKMSLALRATVTVPQP